MCYCAPWTTWTREETGPVGPPDRTGPQPPPGPARAQGHPQRTGPTGPGHSQRRTDRTEIRAGAAGVAAAGGHCEPAQAGEPPKRAARGAPENFLGFQKCSSKENGEIEHHALVLAMQVCALHALLLDISFCVFIIPTPIHNKCTIAIFRYKHACSSVNRGTKDRKLLLMCVRIRNKLL